MSEQEPVNSFVEQYIRRGIETDALNAKMDTLGGFPLPDDIDSTIDRTLRQLSPLRAISNAVRVGSGGYRKLVANGPTSGWADDKANVPEFTEIAPASGEVYANPAASQAMLDDAQFDVEAWLAGEIASEFARAEGHAFVLGNGTNQPLGFLSSPMATTGDGVRPMGTLQYIGTGIAGAFPASYPQDKLIDLVQALRSPYRQGAAFVMNAATAAAVRKFKTTDGQFLFQPSLTAGVPATLLGYPLIETEDMPDIAAGTCAIAFGNFKAGYTIADRATRILRDPYSHKPYVHFYATKRCGGQVTNSEAIKLLRFA